MSENERENGRWSLKEREYVGEDGQIHHHTHVWMDEHVGDSRSSNGRGSGGSRSSGNGQSSRQSQSGSSRGSSGNSSSSERESGRQSQSRGSRGSSESRSSGKSASNSGNEGKSRGRGRSGGQEENGGQQQSAAGKGRSILAAATLGMAAMAAVALVTRRREASREPDIYPGRREEPARDRDDEGSGRGMY